MADNKTASSEDRVEIGPLEKNGDKIIASIEGGNMIAILSGSEVMYVFIYRDEYQCFIHPLDAQEGRHRSFKRDDRNRAMLKNLDSTANQIFEIKFGPRMDFMGVMVAAERGIINFLDSIGQLPVDDFDFMAPLEEEQDKMNSSEGESEENI